MKEHLVRFGPIVVGLLLGWVIVNPPDWLGVDALTRGLLMAVLALVMMVAMILVVVSANLPDDVEITLEPAAAPAMFEPHAEAFRSLGFRPAGAPLRIELKPPAVALPFLDADGTAFGMVARATTVPPKTVVDVTSILEDGRGSLTTLALRDGATLPHAAGQMRQVFPYADLETLYERHREAIAYLEHRGLRMRRLAPQELAEDFRTSVNRQRAAFFRSPVANAFVTLWRATTKRIPEVGSIERQKVAQKTVAELLRV